MSRISTDVLEISTFIFIHLRTDCKRTSHNSIYDCIHVFDQPKTFNFCIDIYSAFWICHFHSLGNHLKRNSNKVQKEQGYFLSIVDETLSGLKVIKGFNGENIFNAKFQASTTRFYKFSNKLLNKQNLAGPTSEFFRNHSYRDLIMVRRKYGVE